MYLSTPTLFKQIIIYRDVGVASFKNGHAVFSENNFLLILIEEKKYFFNLKFVKDFIME